MSGRHWVLALGLTMLAGCANAQAAIPAPSGTHQPSQAARESAQRWFREGALMAHAHGAGRERATNIILFIGDGMSLTTVAAARILEGQRRGETGEENQLSFEGFPDTALSKTYNTDSQTPDSAGTMTAMITGVKTRIGLLSVDQEATTAACLDGKRRLLTAIEIAEAAGLSTGIVTTTRLTHATPAATYAHVADRDWESDADMPAHARDKGCVDIARQFVEFSAGDGIDVAMGGGRSNFLPAGAIDPEHPDMPGRRIDGRDLTADWTRQRAGSHYVWNAKSLAELDLAHTSRLLGLFEPGHMNYEHDRRGDVAGEPSLATMTRAAIAVLSRNAKGYFLMVEGGRIDHAHHAGNAFRALDETIAFSDAVRAARGMTSDSNTLILVTADHSHTLSFLGYPKRGNPILGKVIDSSVEGRRGALAKDALGLPYTTLNYANGPGYAGSTELQLEGPKHFPHEPKHAQAASGRPDLNAVDTTDPDYLQESISPSGTESHGGEDVGVWATGPGAAAVRGTIEQNVIFHLLVQAQPRMVALLCRLGYCEGGVPLLLPGDKPLSR